MKTSRNSSKVRILVISWSVIMVALFFLVRLFFIQIVDSEKYVAAADGAYTSSQQAFDRGLIYFKKKDDTLLSAASVLLGYKVAITPDKITDPDAVFAKLSPLLPEMDYDTFIRRAGRKNDPYEEIATQVEEDVAEQIRALEIPGVALYRHKWRFYPGGDLAAQTIGFLGFSNGVDLRGQYGIERAYENTLSRNANQTYVNAFAEVFGDINETFFAPADQKEGDVVLTIEPTVQDFVQTRLQEVVDAYSADSGSVLVVDPRDGAIVAMASTPTFDPNNFSEVPDIGVFKNPAVENVYEFGSVVKPIVVAAALDAGAVDESTEYFDKGSVVVEDKEIFNFDREGRGTVTIKEILAQSLNTGMVFIMQQMGSDVFREYMYRYKLDEKTDIDLPNEAAPLTKNLESPRQLEYATAAFGQGIAFNMLSLTRALSAVANGGLLVEPHVVDSLQYDLGMKEKFDHTPTEENRILKRESSERLTRVMVKNFDEMLDGKYKIEQHSIASKTGTAQIPNPQGGYYEDRNRHSFVGYFPAFDPQFLVFYTLEFPKGVRYASESLTDPFMDTTEFLINYYNILPDR